ncbi:DNA-3-methyladenine glycosylase I [Beutenbergia cavernae DSM 12333]|uniref:DNA-3-methyladenine glycosylase I n=1 Tax=Beutenbergia cavernae (strain ATCC BAA-8 / DSM 12333 / CCUG 43141 / JCM 11478 / NBRC 16432 / NCIMB 13614 / HKI 0122) TaxID=471853 RepID=C5BV23_BEUC1|nr:DNA-3-methyladenine glycosylase I [Beutenbergia cavernae]ACQ78397.1 DNA-3-methyladenine glycosylase I [Beutenbergia cavernae DSM 12333]
MTNTSPDDLRLDVGGIHTLRQADPPASGARCFGDGDPLYAAYHDTEWGVPFTDSPDERELFERLSLEAFQSGLSWITILRKRDAFRAAFAGFVPEVVATFDDDDVARHLADPGIVRNRLKVHATIANAHALAALHSEGGTLRALLEEHAPEPGPPPATFADVPPETPGSRALTKVLKKRGFAFVGPTTLYSTMEAVGIVNDHLAGCPTRA